MITLEYRSDRLNLNTDNNLGGYPRQLRLNTLFKT